MANLFGDDFEIKPKQTKIKELISKTENIAQEKDISVEKALKSKKVSLEEKLDLIEKNVYSVLGKQKENVIVIRDLETFKKYIDKAIEVGSIAIDTETNNSLDPITCKLMGLCLYVNGQKQAYIPINHINNATEQLLENQLTEEDCKQQLQRVVDSKVFTIFHNYKFDYQVIKCTCNIEVPCMWDTMIVAKLIDENYRAGLKQLYIEKIDPSQEKYSIDHLFTNVQYAQVDPEIFALYAATDSMMTYKLYEWQKPIMESYERENPVCNPYKLFREVELPCIQVIAEMELTGVNFDVEYAERLRGKFNKNLAEVDAKIDKELENLEQTISAWRLTKDANFKTEKVNAEGKVSYSKSKSEQLDTKINLKSPTQLAILFYDIMGVPVVDKKAPRGTGEEILAALQKDYPICEYLLERRSLVKMLDAFINSLPNEINPKTGKIHCDFNQYGAATGRTSCSGPNLQQIPSRQKSMRLLFMADCPKHEIERTNGYYEVDEADEIETVDGWKKIQDVAKGTAIICSAGKDYIEEIKIVGNKYLLYTSFNSTKTYTRTPYILVGNDFSQQEPRLLSFYSQDPNMVTAYQNGKDLYATVASGVYHMDYWDCMEHHQDGSPNLEGKKRRSSVKAVVLGLMYSRGAKAIAEELKCTKEEAQEIIDNFYNSFPTVKNWMNESLKFLREHGYTTDFYGRRRRLPDILLPRFDFELIKKPEEFNPIIGCENRDAKPNKQLVEKYINMINNCRYLKTEFQAIQDLAAKENLRIKDNTGFIAQAERQCVNARIQGGAATMTKIAMNKIFRDPELNSYGFKLLINVHDELIGQCKEIYKDKCAERLGEVMRNCISDICNVPFKSDPEVEHKWYASEVSNEMQEIYSKMSEDNYSEEYILDYLGKKYCEFLPEEILNFIHGIV